MHPSFLSLIVLAIPPIIGSFVVLYLASSGKGVWISHLSAICISFFLAFTGTYMRKPANRQIAAYVIITITCVGLFITLLGNSSGPERWVYLGAFRLYVAPILLPSFIAASSVFTGKDYRYHLVFFTAILCVAIILVQQPDASQVLGLMVASTVVAIQYRLGVLSSTMIFLLLLLVTVWTFLIPDLLDPVSYVEEVFKMALDHSLFTGITVIFSALFLIIGLWLKSFKGPRWLSAVAVYYASLYVCSIAGLTPAPLVGYGAGPIIGFGLMVGFMRWIES